MDELDLIRSFRAHTAPPSAAARARARRAWAPRERRRWSGAPIRRLALGAGALAVAVTVGLALLGGDDGRLSAGDARAAETLRSAASQAEAHGLRAPRPGEHVYLRSLQAQRRSAGGYSWFERSTRESWMGADGALRTRVTARPIAFAGAAARAGWEAAGRPRLAELPAVEAHRFPTAGSQVIPFGSSALTYSQLLALPTDPAELYGRLRAAAAEGGGDSVEDETFTIVSDVMRFVPLPGELRAAFFRAAALIPGIGYSGQARDLAGRAGMAIWFEDKSGRTTLVFDRDTHRLLGSRDGSLFAASFMQEGITRSDRERPAP